ncbi:hypothetical protein HNQ56_004200 [Anaerotaenia torta]|uniref:hypothetical protein n=1 Tax=Anaerotaenia torta TaxID=433293 RepID=UPI003D234840
MILWNESLYVGNKIKRRKNRVIASMNNREAVFGVYCIAFASNPNNLFDIYEANELLFPCYQRSEIRIAGLAGGKQEAVELAHDMLMEVYRKTGKFDVRIYFT